MRLLAAAILLAVLPSEALASAAIARSLLGAGRSLAVPVSLRTPVSLGLPALGASSAPSGLVPTLHLPVSIKLALPILIAAEKNAAAPSATRAKTSKDLLAAMGKSLARSPDGAQEQLSFAFDGAPDQTAGVSAPQSKLVRAVIDPEGREVRLVRTGTRYRVTREGTPKPLVEYDIADIEGDGIPAYTVTRSGRRGLWLDGRILWEDGRYD